MHAALSALLVLPPYLAVLSSAAAATLLTHHLPLLPAGVHNNLFTNINTGAGTRPWQSGGAAERGADAGERSGAVDAAG